MDSFKRDINPTFRKHILNFSKPVVEAAVQPDGMSNDCGWKVVTQLAE